jgi:hypothetical protein
LAATFNFHRRRCRQLEESMSRIESERFVVRVPQGSNVKAAVADHRERTGHGGTVFIVLAPKAM